MDKVTISHCWGFNLVAILAGATCAYTHTLQGGREESADCSDCKSTKPLGTGVCGRAGVRPTTEFLLLGTKQGAPRHQPARTAQTHGRGIKFFLTRKMNEKSSKTSCHYCGMFAKTNISPACHNNPNPISPSKAKQGNFNKSTFIQFF